MQFRQENLVQSNKQNLLLLYIDNMIRFRIKTISKWIRIIDADPIP